MEEGAAYPYVVGLVQAEARQDAYAKNGRPRGSRTRLDPGLAHFEALPDSAQVRMPTVMGLFGCSAATIWRAVRRGAFPAPSHHFQRAASWTVGELRAALRQGKGG